MQQQKNASTVVYGTVASDAVACMRMYNDPESVAETFIRIATGATPKIRQYAPGDLLALLITLR